MDVQRKPKDWGGGGGGGVGRKCWRLHSAVILTRKSPGGDFDYLGLP